MAYRASSIGSTTTLNINILIPTGAVPGDVATLCWAYSNTVTVTDPPGWTIMETATSLSLVVRRYTRTVVAGTAATVGAPGSTVAIATSATSRSTAIMVVQSAQDQASPEDTSTPTAALYSTVAATRNNPAATTTATRSLMCFVFDRGGTASLWTPPPGWTEAQDGGPAVSSGTTTGAAAYLNAAPAGAVGGGTWTSAGTGQTHALTMLVVVNPSVNVPPTANAGSNAVTTFGTTTTLSATDGDVDGTIVSRLWTCTSAPPGATVVIVNPTSASASFVPPVPDPWTYEFRYVVTDNTGASSDPASSGRSGYTKRFVRGDVISPVSVISNDGWSVHGVATDEVDAVRDTVSGAPDLTTGVESPSSTGVARRIRYRMAPMFPPGSGVTRTLYLDEQLTVAGSGVATVTLYEGATARKTWTATPAAGSNVQNDYPLTSGEVASITSWDELDLDLSWT